jgi:hypothetical protein
MALVADAQRRSRMGEKSGRKARVGAEKRSKMGKYEGAGGLVPTIHG